MLHDYEIWPFVDHDDLWIFDKLILSKKLGHVCGPVGVNVPKPDHYVVRPCVNINGMGLGASIKWLENDTDHLPAGYFWQEKFTGDHLSIDFLNGTQIRCTQGFKENLNDLARFSLWKVINQEPVIPPLIKYFVNKYKHVNVEMINGKIIEVHLRGNPDFHDNATEVIPVWKNDIIDVPNGYIFIADADADRIGMYKKY